VMDYHIEEDEVPLKRKNMGQSSKGKQAWVSSGGDPSGDRESF